MIRRAGPADAVAVAEVLITSRRAALGAIPPSVHDDHDVRTWVATTVISSHEVWIVDEPDAGVVAAMVLADDWVDQLYVLPGLAGRGLGTQLLDLAKQQRPHGLQLWTFATNTGAQRFYLRHGFVVAQRTDGSGNEEGAPDIRFVWPAPSGPLG